MMARGKDLISSFELMIYSL